MTYDAKIMNMQATCASQVVGNVDAYYRGHRDARHQAATIAAGADAEIARLKMVIAALEAYARGEPSNPPRTGVEPGPLDQEAGE